MEQKCFLKNSQSLLITLKKKKKPIKMGKRFGWMANEPVKRESI